MSFMLENLLADTRDRMVMCNMSAHQSLFYNIIDGIFLCASLLPASMPLIWPVVDEDLIHTDMDLVSFYC